MMRDQEWIGLKDAASALNLGESTLRKGLISGKYPGRQVAWGSRQKWQVRLCDFKNDTASSETAKLISQWERDQASGFHSGRAISPRRVHENTYGLRVFWQYLKQIPDIKAIAPADIDYKQITADNIRAALANVPVDYEAKKDHHASRINMYVSCLSFATWLTKAGKLPPAQVEAIKAEKPKRRVFPARKTVLRPNQLDELISLNDRWSQGRSIYDRELTKIIVMLCAYAGLRRNELCQLQVGDIDLKNRELHVMDGKGHKVRYVGIVPPLFDQIKNWLALRCQNKKSGAFLVLSDGKPITIWVINHRIQRLAQKAGQDITPHGLRRTFATVMESYGMPWSYIKESLGHEKITTTQGYILTDKKQAADWLKNWGQDSPGSAPSKKEKISVVDLLKIAKNKSPSVK